MANKSTPFVPASPPVPATTNGDASADDFLARERAALGDDAAQFASVGDDDLLGGGDDGDLLGEGGGNANEEIKEFESNFPGVDTRNDVCFHDFSALVIGDEKGCGGWKGRGEGRG